jgi:hypothetical protein
MALALIFAGVLMTIAAVRGTHAELAALIKGDFTGPANFLYWVGAVLLIGAIGYVPPLKKLSIAFFAVILLGVLFAKKNATSGGFFAQLSSAIAGTSKTVGSTSTADTSGNQTATQQSNGLPTLPDFPTSMNELWQMFGIAN